MQKFKTYSAYRLCTGVGGHGTGPEPSQILKTSFQSVKQGTYLLCLSGMLEIDNCGKTGAESLAFPLTFKIR